MPPFKLEHYCSARRIVAIFQPPLFLLRGVVSCNTILRGESGRFEQRRIRFREAKLLLRLGFGAKRYDFGFYRDTAGHFYADDRFEGLELAGGGDGEAAE